MIAIVIYTSHPSRCGLVASSVSEVISVVDVNEF